MSIRITTANVDQAMREERVEATKWDNRCESVLRLLKEIDADILGVQEVRDLDTARMKCGEFIGRIIDQSQGPDGSKYCAVPCFYNSHPHSFGGCVFYRKNRFRLESVNCVYYDVPTSDPHDHMMPRVHTFVKFTDLATKKLLTVVNVHFPMKEHEKWEGIRVLLEELEKISHPHIVIGDFNFFDDLDGVKMRTTLTQTYADAAQPLRLRATGELMSGTFIGFEHDPWHSDLSNGLDKHMSRLDHMFYQGLSKLNDAMVWTLDNQPITNSSYPSDHCFVTCEFEIMN